MLLAGVPMRTPVRLPPRKTAPASCQLRVVARLRVPPPPQTEPSSNPSSRTMPANSRRQLDRHNSSSSSSGALVAGAALALLLPLADPGAAAAAEHAANSGAMYWTCVGLGGASVVTTLLFTARFLLSYFPGLERRAKTRPHAMLLRAVTAADPLLDPITKGFFRMTEQGDLNYGAMALLAVVSGVMTMLVGHDGMLVEQVPDLGMLATLQYLVYVQHMMLLPMWVFVVFRYFLLI